MVMRLLFLMSIGTSTAAACNTAIIVGTIIIVDAMLTLVILRISVSSQMIMRFVMLGRHNYVWDALAWGRISVSSQVITLHNRPIRFDRDGASM